MATPTPDKPCPKGRKSRQRHSPTMGYLTLLVALVFTFMAYLVAVNAGDKLNAAHVWILLLCVTFLGWLVATAMKIKPPDFTAIARLVSSSLPQRAADHPRH